MSQLAVEPGWTPFAGVAPTLAYGGAAQLSRADDALKIRQALAILHFRVTRSGSGKDNAHRGIPLEPIEVSGLSVTAYL